MKRITLTLVALLLPVAAFALDFTNSTSRYSDAPFDTATTAGISVLTNLGAVSGNPNGTFAPNRAVNRAEFLKILFLSNPSVSVTANDAGHCFPDVQASDWFSQYVCLAKVRNTVGGYPDGTFKPAQTVNYAEALKMLGEAFNIKGAAATTPWYQQYADAGSNAQVLLEPPVAYDTLLTRGQVARLVAAYRANHDGELAYYRAFEMGEAVSMSSSSSSSEMSNQSSEVSSASVSSSSASSVSSSSSASSALGLFPARSHFLLTGTQTPVVADGMFTSNTEDASIRYVDFTLFQQVKSVDHFVLVDQNGTQIMTLTLSGNDNTNNVKWHGEAASGTYILHKGVPTQLGLEAVMKNSGNGGVLNELFETQNFSLTAQGTSGASYNLVPTSTDYPMHQTTNARITAVRNAGSGSATMSAGINRQIGSFAISGQTTTGGELILESMEFTLKSTDVSVSNVRIGGPAVIVQKGCGINPSQTSDITCNVIPDAYKNVGGSPMIIPIYADVSLSGNAASGSIQLSFPGRGAIGQNGAVHWSDNVGHYNWIESDVPLEDGTKWTVGQ
ncbi:MAG TPA: S-layer homology domain-containing protein [Candidatus Peribacteraceae bacterium]|nr:S-layer homology domain-containing protein [Candidatus Peribacteraceae bacterium]